MIRRTYDPFMKLRDRKTELMDEARALKDRATSTLESLSDTATSVKVSTDTAAMALIGIGLMTAMVLLLVMRIDHRLSPAA